MAEAKHVPEAGTHGVRRTEAPGTEAERTQEEQPLNGQVAIVTGGATGIGAGIASKLRARGAHVVINHLNQKPAADALVESMKQHPGAKAIAVSADISKPDEVTRLVEETVSAFGRLDIMVANAGIQVDAKAIDMKFEQWERAMSVDLGGTFLCAQAAARRFLKQGVNESISRAAGKILCMLSVHDRIPWMGHVNYAAAKGGAHMMMQTLAQEWAGSRIRVVGISPGAVKTAINKSVWDNEETMKELLKLIPYQRIGDVEDVSKVAAWLVSDEADYVTGTTIYVDGGMSLYPGFMGNG